MNGDTSLALLEEQLHLLYRKVKVSTTAGVTLWKIQVPSLYVPDSQATPTPPTSVPGDDLKNDYPTTADHYILASNAELDIALAGAVQATLASSTDSVEVKRQKLFDLANAAGLYRKAAVGAVVKTATVNILNASFASEADRTAALEAFTSGAVQADPSKAGAIVATMLPLVIPKVIAYKKVGANYVANPAATNTVGGVFSQIPARTDAADDIVEEAVKHAATFAVAIVNSALGKVAQIVDISGSAANDPVTNGTAGKAKELIKNISAAAINAAYENQAGYLADEIAVAIGTKLRGLSYLHKVGTNVKTPLATSSDVATAIFSASNHPTGLKEIGLVAAGLFKGFKGSTLEGDTTANIIGSIKTTLSFEVGGTNARYLDNVRGGFLDASIATPTNKILVADAVVAGTTGDAVNYIAARITGAAASLPSLVTYAPAGDAGLGSFLGRMLELDAAGNGTQSVTDIVEAAVRANSPSVAAIAKLAVKWSNTTAASSEGHRLGQIVSASGQGLKGQPLYNTLYGAAIAPALPNAGLVRSTTTITRVDDQVAGALLKTPVKLAQLDAASILKIKEITNYALAGAQDAEAKTSALLAVVKGAGTTTTYQFYKPILEAAIDSAIGNGQKLAASDQWRAVMALLVLKKLSTTTEFDGTYDTTISPTHPKPTANTKNLLELIPAYARSLAGYDAAQNETAITHGADLVNKLQLSPKALFNKSYEAFDNAAVRDDASGNAPLALITGVSLVNPASAPIAAALAVKLSNTSDEQIVKTAKGVNPALAARIKMTVDVGRYVKTSPGDMFDYLDQKIFQNPTLLGDIVTGATIVRPEYAHIVASAVGFKAAAKVPAVVPQLFNYAHITSTDPLLNAPLATSYDNRVDATSAITAALTSGILSAKTGLKTGSGTVALAANEVKYLKAAVTALVKQVTNVTGNTPVNSPYLPGSYANLSANVLGGNATAGGGEGFENFMQSDGSAPVLDVDGHTLIGGFTRTTQSGPAGVVTGFMTQIIKSNDTVLTDGATGLVGAVLTAAVGVVKADVTKILAIAQAAGQAAKSIAAGFTLAGQEQIVAAVLNTFLKKIGPSLVGIDNASHPNYVGTEFFPNGKRNPYFDLKAKVENAVKFGVLAANEHIPGAGAAGVINYSVSYNSPLNTPVTSIMDL